MKKVRLHHITIFQLSKPSVAKQFFTPELIKREIYHFLAMLQEPIVWRPSGIDLTNRTLKRLEPQAWFSDVLVETILHPMLDIIQRQPIRLVLGWNPKWGSKQQSGYNATVIVMLEQNHFYLILISQKNSVEVIDSLATHRQTTKADLENVHKILGLQDVAPAYPGQVVPKDFTLWTQNDEYSCGPIAIHHLFQVLQPITSQNWRDIDPRRVHWRLYLARFIFDHVEHVQVPLSILEAHLGGAEEGEEVQIVQPPPKKQKTGFFSQYLFDATDKITSERPGTGASQSAGTTNEGSVGSQLKSDHKAIGEAARCQPISADSESGLVNVEPSLRTDSNIEGKDSTLEMLSESEELHFIKWLQEMN